MWSERKQSDVNRPDTSSARPDTSSARPEQSTPVRTATAQNTAIIGKGMVIKGQVRSAEHMHVDGEIDGALYLAGFDLTVTADARVRADVTAREVDVAGVIDGNVDATKKITVRKGGRLLGDLKTPGIVIEDGAYFKGKIEIVNSEARDQAPVVAAAAAATAG
jgi:cytoskeletal protein CcmA (bactofilin family)